MSKIDTLARRITRQAERLGYSVSEHQAQTNTLYLSCLHDNGVRVKIRIADHGECYCSEDISVDPDGCTAEQAIKLLEKNAGVSRRDVMRIERAEKRAKKLAAEWRKLNCDCDYCDSAHGKDFPHCIFRPGWRTD